MTKRITGITRAANPNRIITCFLSAFNLCGSIELHLSSHPNMSLNLSFSISRSILLRALTRIEEAEIFEEFNGAKEGRA
jgi:hypothetical protein